MATRRLSQSSMEPARTRGWTPTTRNRRWRTCSPFAMSPTPSSTSTASWSRRGVPWTSASTCAWSKPPRIRRTTLRRSRATPALQWPAVTAAAPTAPTSMPPLPLPHPQLQLPRTKSCQPRTSSPLPIKSPSRSHYIDRLMGVAWLCTWSKVMHVQLSQNKNNNIAICQEREKC